MCGESPASVGGSKLPLHSKITLLWLGKRHKHLFALALQNAAPSFRTEICSK